MRRRYDTQAFNGQVEKERRNTWILILMGLGILAFLVFFYTHHIGTEDVPTVPVLNAKSAAKAPPALVAPLPAPETTKAEAPPPPPPPPTNAYVTIDLGKGAPLWVDEKLVGNKIKTHDAELSPGKHAVKTKL